MYIPLCPLLAHLLSVRRTNERTYQIIARQVQETLSFLVTIKDRVAVGGQTDSDDDNLVQVPITVIVLDENDNPPEFQNVSPKLARSIVIKMLYTFPQ